MKLRGKISLWFWIIVLAGDAVCLWKAFSSQEYQVIMIATIAVYNLICLPILIRNYVEIQENKLTVVFGIMKDSIPISEITEVYTTHDPISSTAASLDRIAIKGKRQNIMCSVYNKSELFEELRRQNPNIQIH